MRILVVSDIHANWPAIRAIDEPHDVCICLGDLVDYGPQPVAWAKTYKGARVFFTTLGHPEDFQLEAVRRLLINGIYWALGREVPAGGADAAIVGEYDPPQSGAN